MHGVRQSWKKVMMKEKMDSELLNVTAQIKHKYRSLSSSEFIYHRKNLFEAVFRN